MTIFQSINSDEIAATASLIAVASAKVLNAEDLNVFGNFIIAVGGLMTSIAAQEQALQVKKDTGKDETPAMGYDVQKQIKEIQEQLKELQSGKKE